VAVGVGLRELLAPIRPRDVWPEVQELIRWEIFRGTIRVRRKPSGGICIVPVGMPEDGEQSEVGPPSAPLTARIRRLSSPRTE